VLATQLLSHRVVPSISDEVVALREQYPTRRFEGVVELCSGRARVDFRHKRRPPLPAALASRPSAAQRCRQPLPLSTVAVGSCDVDSGVAWAQVEVCDDRGSVLWRIAADGEHTTPVQQGVRIEDWTTVLGLCEGIDPLDHPASVFETLAHATFPARSDAMWMYLRWQIEWDKLPAMFDAARRDFDERMRNMITLSAPPAVEELSAVLGEEEEEDEAGDQRHDDGRGDWDLASDVDAAVSRSSAVVATQPRAVVVPRLRV
jgi:hypothetical protein